MASSVYRKLLDTLARYIQCKNIIDSNTVVWLPALADTLKQPVQHRSRYHAITLLIPRVGAQTIVANEPTIFTHLIDVMRMREVSSSCCSCICALLKNLVSEEGDGCPKKSSNSLSVTSVKDKCERFRASWVPSVVCALCPDNDFTAEKLTLANNVAEYVLPEIMQVDKFCAPAMFAAIRNRSRVSSPARVLWALVHVSLQARLHGLEGKDIDEGNNESDSDTLGTP